MQAKFKGTCGVCGRQINVGDEISWSRQERGKAYHRACKPVATVMPDEKLLAALKLLLTKTEADSMPDELTEAEVEALPVPVAEVAKPVAKPTKHKLDNLSPWYDILTAVLPYSDRILLIGPPSTGKSTTAMLYAGVQHRVTMTETTSREDLIGMFHLIEGATKWVDGPFTSAMRKGEAVLVDEIDRYSPECASLLYSLIDDQPHISLPTGEFIKAAKGYKVLMTTNDGIETLPIAVQDRVEVLISANVPHEAALAGMDKALSQVVYHYYSAIPAKVWKGTPTVRRMRTFTRLLAASIPQQVAANLVFGSGAKEVLSAITSAEAGVR
jgi:hypothetical protein